MSILKKTLFTLAIILGLFVIIVVIVANNVTAGFNDSSIDTLTKYVLEFRGMEGLQEIIDSDVGLMFLMYKINDYSHWILTVSAVWITIFLYLIGNMRRTKSERNKRRKES